MRPAPRRKETGDGHTPVKYADNDDAPAYVHYTTVRRVLSRGGRQVAVVLGSQLIRSRSVSDYEALCDNVCGEVRSFHYQSLR